jgi:hypothetical protein
MWRRVARRRERASNGGMIPEAPFLFSIVGLSASLAGLAGLVAALRRADGVRGRDLFRLREIVEFSFANVLLAVQVVPLALLLGSTSSAVRVAAVLAVGYLIVGTAILLRRQRRLAIAPTLAWYVAAGAINIVVLAVGLAAIAYGSIAAYEALLVGLLARPMLAFLLVLSSFDQP